MWDIVFLFPMDAEPLSGSQAPFPMGKKTIEGIFKVSLFDGSGITGYPQTWGW